MDPSVVPGRAILLSRTARFVPGSNAGGRFLRRRCLLAAEQEGRRDEGDEEEREEGPSSDLAAGVEPDAGEEPSDLELLLEHHHEDRPGGHEAEADDGPKPRDRWARLRVEP